MPEVEAHSFDASGLICPLPVLKARKLLLRLPAGAELRVTVTDPHAPKDFALFCAESGHVLKSVTPGAGSTEILLQRAA
jgi:tRNA 2-thiouridine synthesizing protein A